MDFACELFAGLTDVTDLCGCGDLDGQDVIEILGEASDFLAYQSDMRVTGRCTATIFPCCEERWCGCWRGGRHWWGCPCEVHGIPLKTPIVSVDLVTIDSVALPSGDYYVMDSKLVKAAGEWPCKDLAVTYTWGRRPPALARLAAAELACAWINAALPSKGTKLPPDTTSVIHQGVQIGLVSRAQVQDQVLQIGFSLPRVQAFLAAYGPKSKGDSLVYSPDIWDGWIYHA